MNFTLRTVAILLLASCVPAFAAAPPELQAVGHDRRIDVTWGRDLPVDAQGWHVYRAASADGPFEKLTDSPQDYAVCSDFLGENGAERWYRVTQVDATGTESAPSNVVHAKTREMTTDELLTSLQQAHFRYFWEFAHPVSGLAREGMKHKRNVCTSGGTGFGLMTLVVGAERGFAPRAEIAAQLLKQVRFLQDVTPRYHGVWAHWIDGATGETIPFSGPKDNGGDIVETAFLVQGLLTAAGYFDRDDPTESEIRTRVAQLWREVEWDWYLGPEPRGTRLYWHWSPDYQFEKGHRFGGNFNECMIAYILGLASPTHPLPVECYYEGWAGGPRRRPNDPGYANGEEYYGVKLAVGWPLGGPLFFTHYSYIGLDPRHVQDRYCNYYDNNRAISLINHAYCADNPQKFDGYSDLVWGLTASVTPGGYHAHEPRHDRGTITPTAALSAMPYTPEKSIPTAVHFYRDLGDRLWGPFGFWDAFNPGKKWVADTCLAIDQGPIAPMIENYRTQLCWKAFMKNEDIIRGLQRVGILAPQPAPLAPGPR